MKKILLAAMSLVLLTIASIAQQAQGQNKIEQIITVNDEHLLMKEGKIFHNINGKEMMLQNQMTMHNGTVMNADGSYQLKNGKKRQLRNGQCMDMGGKKYRSHHMFQKNMMRTHSQNMHSGGNHQNMNMGGHGYH